MKRVINDISKGKNIEENLKKYVEGMKSIHFKYALVRLALNYYTFYQIDLDENTKREGHKDMADEVHHLIRDGVISDKLQRQKGFEILDRNREILIKEVAALTYYVDAFRIYEHVLNRVEYRFRKEGLPEKYSDEELCRMLMHYILSDEDNVMINSRISEVIAELPVRITKAKFFEYVSNGLSIYKGSEYRTLDDFLYRIKTSSMLCDEEEYAEIFPELADVLISFKETDFSEIQRHTYEMLAGSVEEVSVYIEDVMNVSMMLMEVMNDAYSVLLTRENGEDDRTIRACREIIEAVNDYFILGSEVSEETEDMFVMLEGSQEALYSKINTYNLLDEIQTSYQAEIEKNNLQDGLHDLIKLQRLSSDSLFAELETEDDSTLVNEQILETEKNKLIEELKKFFSNNGKNINRAVMSSVLAGLPVFFNNISELQDFIYNTLQNCTDIAEKTACVEILHQIMED